MRAKHRAANNKYLQGGVRKSTRLTILVVIYTLFLTVTIIAHAKEGMRRFAEQPVLIGIWSVCFLLCLTYHKKRSTYPVSAEHTTLPLLTVMLLVTGYFSDVALFVIIAVIITSIFTARSITVGILRAGTTLAPVPLIKGLFADTSQVLGTSISPHSINEALSTYQFRHWLLPLLIITVAVPTIRLICDIVTFFFAQIPIRKAIHEYSLSHTLAMMLADLMAIDMDSRYPAVRQYRHEPRNRAFGIHTDADRLFAAADGHQHVEPAGTIQERAEKHRERERRVAVAGPGA